MKRMGKLLKNSDGFSVVEMLLVVGVVIVIALVGFLVFHSNNKPKSAVSTNTKSTSNTAGASYTALSPATVPSKVAECSQTLTYQSTGDSLPVECDNGDLNTLEWNALSALEPKVMTLGYNATESQVQSALCSDASDSDSDANTKSANVIEATTYQIAALYYGWNFATNPSVVLSNGTC